MRKEEEEEDEEEEKDEEEEGAKKPEKACDLQMINPSRRNSECQRRRWNPKVNGGSWVEKTRIMTSCDGDVVVVVGAYTCREKGVFTMTWIRPNRVTPFEQGLHLSPLVMVA